MANHTTPWDNMCGGHDYELAELVGGPTAVSVLFPCNTTVYRCGEVLHCQMELISLLRRVVLYASV